jgi:hypothetical protein
MHRPVLTNVEGICAFALTLQRRSMGWRMQELQGLSHARLRAAVHGRSRRLRRLWSRTSFIRTRSAHDPFGSMLAQCQSMRVFAQLTCACESCGALPRRLLHMCVCACATGEAGYSSMISPTAVTVPRVAHGTRGGESCGVLCSAAGGARARMSAPTQWARSR